MTPRYHSGETVRFSSGLLRRFASTGDYQIVKRLPGSPGKVNWKEHEPAVGRRPTPSSLLIFRAANAIAGRCPRDAPLFGAVASKARAIADRGSHTPSCRTAASGKAEAVAGCCSRSPVLAPIPNKAAEKARYLLNLLAATLRPCLPILIGCVALRILPLCGNPSTRQGWQDKLLRQWTLAKSDSAASMRYPDHVA